MVGWAEIDLDHGELVEIDFQAWVLALAQDPAICTTHGIGIENLCHATVRTPGPTPSSLFSSRPVRYAPHLLRWSGLQDIALDP